MSKESREHVVTFWESASSDLRKEFEEWMMQYADEALKFAQATQYLDLNLWPDY